MSGPVRAQIVSLVRRDLSLTEIGGWIGRHHTALILALGALLRVAQFVWNRTAWLDETSLWANIRDLTPGRLFGPLQSNQIAPPGFLLVEWLVRVTLGSSYRALRLFPLIGSLFSLVLFQRVARRCLRPTAEIVALLLFATSDDLIYFSSELKQYSTDVAFALACTLGGLITSARMASGRALLALAAGGAAALWFSHPCAFILAGVGTTLLVTALRRGEIGRFAALCLMVLAWGISFAGVYAVSRVQLADPHNMQVFWAFAFPTRPPVSLWDACWWPRRLLYVFVNPLGFNSPFGWAWLTVPAAAFFLVGLVSSARSNATAFGMLALPIVFTALAASVRLYPFHGRLVLFLVPAFLLFIADGAVVVAERVGKRRAWIVILGLVLLFPTIRAMYHVGIARDRVHFDQHGDWDPHRGIVDRPPFGLW